MAPAPANATEILDSYSDGGGMSTNKGDDWSDVKHSERKKRDRILDDDIVLELMRKSDLPGLRRLFGHVGILVISSCVLNILLHNWSCCGDMAKSDIIEQSSCGTICNALNCVQITVALVFQGFVWQTFGYCVQHETMHMTAFKSRWLNNLVGFCFSVPCFEFPTHERCMHKSHHTFTNHPEKDPELTSFFPNAQEPGFRKVSLSHSDYWKEMFYLHESVKSHVMRIYNCAIGNPVDYTGVQWSLTQAEKARVRVELQLMARFQIGFYCIVLPVLWHFIGTFNLLYYWLVPAIIGFAPINYVRNQ